MSLALAIPGRGWWACARPLVIACLALLPGPGAAQAPSASVPPFVMAADAPPGSVTFIWSEIIYSEAFRRLGLPVDIVSVSLARRSALVAEGAIDGEVSRIHAYADTHPDLVRVEEPVMDFTFSIFSANPRLGTAKLEDLPPDALVEYRRGILLCETVLKKAIAAERISNVVSTEQGIKKLQAGRSDAYCDIDLYVREALNATDPKSSAAVRKLFDVATLPTYPYLYKKHAALAPRLAAVIRRMRAEGLLAAYLKQAEQRSGLAQ